MGTQRAKGERARQRFGGSGWRPGRQLGNGGRGSVCVQHLGGETVVILDASSAPEGGNGEGGLQAGALVRADPICKWACGPFS
jgi:hypothetical protein